MTRFHIFYTIGVLAAIAFFATNARAADVTLQFDPVSGATGYKIEQGTCTNVLWSGSLLDIGDVTVFTYPDVSEIDFVLFRIGAYNDSQPESSWRTYSGAWYDERLKPLADPSGTGIQ